MRVLHLYAGNLYGGVETFLTTLARHASAAEMQSTYGLCFHGRLSGQLAALNASVEMLGQVRFSRPWTVWRARQKLWRLLSRQQFDVVICHSTWPHAVFAPVVRRAGVPLVYWAHNPPADHWLDRRAARIPPDLLVANSRYTLAAYDAWFINCRRIALPLPVTAPQLPDRESNRRQVRNELQTAMDVAVIVCASRLERWKGHTLLLEAMTLIKEVPGWCAWIAGGPQRDSERQYLQSLHQQTAQSGLAERVKFIGQREDISRIFAAADVYCQPNVSPEPFGIVFIEALYAGLPVVTTRMGAATEIVTGDCGRLVSPDARSLAAVLRQLIEDRSHRAELGTAGPGRAAELCDPAITLPAIESALRSVVVIAK